VRQGLLGVELAGRFQVLPGRPTVILDVAHNPHAAAVLAANLDNMGFHPRTLAVLGMLRDKDAAGVIDKVADRVDRWYLGGTAGPRGLPGQALAGILRQRRPAAAFDSFDDVASAFAAARGAAAADDRIVVFGSFLTVADVMRAQRQPDADPR